MREPPGNDVSKSPCVQYGLPTPRATCGPQFRGTGSRSPGHFSRTPDPKSHTPDPKSHNPDPKPQVPDAKSHTPDFISIPPAQNPKSQTPIPGAAAWASALSVTPAHQHANHQTTNHIPPPHQTTTTPHHTANAPNHQGHPPPANTHSWTHATKHQHTKPPTRQGQCLARNTTPTHQPPNHQSPNHQHAIPPTHQTIVGASAPCTHTYMGTHHQTTNTPNRQPTMGRAPS